MSNSREMARTPKPCLLSAMTSAARLSSVAGHTNVTPASLDCGQPGAPEVGGS